MSFKEYVSQLMKSIAMNLIMAGLCNRANEID
jgi:hypothetical protein